MNSRFSITLLITPVGKSVSKSLKMHRFKLNTDIRNSITLPFEAQCKQTIFITIGKSISGATHKLRDFVEGQLKCQPQCDHCSFADSPLLLLMLKRGVVYMINNLRIQPLNLRV